MGYNFGLYTAYTPYKYSTVVIEKLVRGEECVMKDKLFPLTSGKHYEGEYRDVGNGYIHSLKYDSSIGYSPFMITFPCYIPKGTLYFDGESTLCSKKLVFMPLDDETKKRMDFIKRYAEIKC